MPERTSHGHPGCITGATPRKLKAERSELKVVAVGARYALERAGPSMLRDIGYTLAGGRDDITLPPTDPEPHPLPPPRVPPDPPPTIPKPSTPDPPLPPIEE